MSAQVVLDKTPGRAPSPFACCSGLLAVHIAPSLEVRPEAILAPPLTPALQVAAKGGERKLLMTASATLGPGFQGQLGLLRFDTLPFCRPRWDRDIADPC